MLSKTNLEGGVEILVKQMWSDPSQVLFGVQRQERENIGDVGKECLDKRNYQQGMYTITRKISSLSQNFSWHLTGVYESHCKLEKQERWWEIVASKAFVQGLGWCIEILTLIDS